MQVYSHVAEGSSNYKKPWRYLTLRRIVQSLYIHIHLEFDEPLCDATGCLEIISVFPKTFRLAAPYGKEISFAAPSGEPIEIQGLMTF